MMTPRAQVHRLSIFVLVIALLLEFHAVSAAPQVCVGSSWKPQEKTEYGPFKNFTSKILGAFVKMASYICQWMPQLPEWIKPSKPTLRVVPTSVCIRDMDFSSEEHDFR